MLSFLHKLKQLLHIHPDSLQGPLLGAPDVTVDLTDPNVGHIYEHHYLPLAREAAATVGLRLSAVDSLTQVVFAMLQYSTPSPATCAAAVVMLTDVLVDEHNYMDPTIEAEARHPVWHCMAECVTRVAAANTLGTLRCMEDVVMLFNAADRLLGGTQGTSLTCACSVLVCIDKWCLYAAA